MTLRSFREVFFGATRDSFNSVRTIPMVMVAAIMFAGIAGAQNSETDALEQQPFFSARLSGFNEVIFVAGQAGPPLVPPALRGAISTPANGRFTAILDSPDLIQYELSYEGLVAPVTQAHIHFGQRHTVGGIIVWLCQTAGTQAPEAVRSSTPLCPSEGTVSGTITPAQVLAQDAQGFAAGDFDELVRAIRNRAAYANVHTEKFTAGEIRGQIRSNRNRDN
ncbi:MAG TPA: CHRD domain-containing protein [Candidatus Binatia bacterium]